MVLGSGLAAGVLAEDDVAVLRHLDDGRTLQDHPRQTRPGARRPARSTAADVPGLAGPRPARQAGAVPKAPRGAVPDLHSLRHSTASRYIAAGMSVEEVADHLGDTVKMVLGSTGSRSTTPSVGARGPR